MTLWTDFAKNMEISSWPQYSSDTGSYLSIGPSPETRQSMAPERMLLWDKLVWSPLVNRLKANTEKRKEDVGLVVPGSIKYLWPTIVQPVWASHHGHLVHHVHPYSVIQV